MLRTSHSHPANCHSLSHPPTQPPPPRYHALLRWEGGGGKLQLSTRNSSPGFFFLSLFSPSPASQRRGPELLVWPGSKRSNRLGRVGRPTLSVEKQSSCFEESRGQEMPQDLNPTASGRPRTSLCVCVCVFERKRKKREVLNKIRKGSLCSGMDLFFFFKAEAALIA